MLCLRAGQHTLNLHRTGLVNSAAHLWGDRPYDGSIAAAENIPVAMLTGRSFTVIQFTYIHEANTCLNSLHMQIRGNADFCYLIWQ